MRLFATWEIEKSAGNCIPRLCSLTLSRLVLQQKLEAELTSVIIAVKMQSSKRTLRSNEIPVPTVGLLDTELDLSFSLQYPHFLKRDGNNLQIMLQRRKRYKNRTILGYKTLAVGQLNMAQVLQCSVGHELSLYSPQKDQAPAVAHLMMLSISSQPVDHEENGRRKMRDRSPDIDNYSDEDEAQYDNDDWSNDEMSDLDQMLDDDRTQRNKGHHGPARTVIPRQSQRNIKQRFRALLRKFKISEEVLDSEQDQDLADPNQEEIADLLNELEDLSDSGPEMDTLSVLSTPKPSLRPFFTGRCGSTDILEIPRDTGRLSDDSSKRNDSDSHPENLTDHEFSDPQQSTNSGASPPRPRDEKPRTTNTTNDSAKQKLFNREKSISLKENKGAAKERRERRSSYGNIEGLPRKALLEQLASLLDQDDRLPDCFILVNTVEPTGQLLAQNLTESQYKVISTCSKADVKATVSHLVTKLQKFCNSNNRTPSAIRIGLCGGDGYVNSVLRPYVDQFSARSHDWQNYVTFYVIPFGASSSVGKYLGGLDPAYHTLFVDNWWNNVFDKSDNHKSDMFEVVNRIKRYLSSAGHVLQLPIAEAMVTYKEKSTDDESSQIFIPFLNEVRIGPADLSQSLSVDFEEGVVSTGSATTSTSGPGSPPHSSGGLAERLSKESQQTPPNSPSITSQLAQVAGSSGGSAAGTPPSTAASSPCQTGSEYMDLQLDYWTIIPRPDSGELKDKAAKKESNKASLKTAFRCVQVFRLPQAADALPSTMCMVVITKEKKQKIMRLGKKAKESESKSQVMDGISRLICTSKSQTTPLKVTIDGIDWAGVKFFQLSSQWQTHVKHFPVAVFASLDY